MNRLNQAIEPNSARRIYDTIGRRYDWFERFDAQAKERSKELLDLTPGLKLLEIGVGTGKQHLSLHEGIAPDGIAFGIDISQVMLRLTRERSGALLSQADTRFLPFPSTSFDRLYTSYVLDLLPWADLPGVLLEFHRVLKDNGRMVLVAMTEGVNISSRLLVATWKALYTVSPIACAGCRPLRLEALFKEAGLIKVRREVVVQLAVPSEIILAWK